MISFTGLGHYGRLGNQLFQYAILIAVANKRGFEIKIPQTNNRFWHGQKSQLYNFKLSAKLLEYNEFYNLKFSFVEPDGKNYSYLSSVFEVNDFTNFFGFFQNYQYYVDCEDILLKEFQLNDEIVNKAKNNILNIKNNNLGYEVVSLHLRRGDSLLSMYGDGRLDKKSLWYNYFENAKQQLPPDKKYKFLIFTGGNRNIDDPTSDYFWCKSNLVGEEFVHMNERRSTIDDFALMLQCDHHILSPISTLSWWVGFLNKKTNKIVIAPKKFFFLSKELGDGFYPNNFILV